MPVSGVTQKCSARLEDPKSLDSPSYEYQSSEIHLRNQKNLKCNTCDKELETKECIDNHMSEHSQLVNSCETSDKWFRMEEESNNQRPSEHHIQNKESTETELLTKFKKLKDKYNYFCTTTSSEPIHIL